MWLVSTVLDLGMFTGCASESAWTVRDRHGWPVQTWARSSKLEAPRTGPCDGVGRHVTIDPDSVSRRLAWACGHDVPGKRR